MSFAPAASAEVVTERVPLDHAAPDGAQIDLAYERLPATGEGARRGTVVFLSGGPGEPAVRFAEELADGPLRGLRADYDLVFVDQRGTGRSSPLRCSTAPNGRFSPNLSTERLREAIAACGAELGDARRHYSTYATALDIERVRAAIGAERIIPLGVSYGGQVAGEYARRFPDRVDRLVLDSTSPVEAIDTMSKLPQLALERVFREACYPPGCNEILGRPITLIEEAADRLSRRPLAGATGEDVYSLVMASDQDALLRTDLPAVLQAAIGRDGAPLRRLLRYAESGSGGGVNEVRFLATACVEGNQPWDPASDPEGREALLAEHLRGARADYRPFGIELVAGQIAAAQCLSWPATPRAPLPPSVESGPDVPVLFLAGREDLRTPLENQRRAAAQFPRADVLAVPGAGHSVLAGDSRCARQALRAFLRQGDLTGSCSRGSTEIEAALPYFPSLRAVPRAAGRLPAVVERTATAVDLTLRDAARWADSRSSTRGVRGGSTRLLRSRLALVRYELVPGVRVSGLVGQRGGTLRVTGSGATGTLRVGRTGRMTGVLNGLVVRYRPLG